MNPSSWLDIGGDSGLEALWEDGERIFCKKWSAVAGSDPRAVLVVFPAAEHPAPAILDRLAREYELRDSLDAAWAARPVELVLERGRTMLVLELPGGEPLGRLIGRPMELGKFLRCAVAILGALGRMHECGLVHKDIKPSNILVDIVAGRAWLMGFGLVSRLPRERQSAGPPEFIAGTLPYMAPEQTGRMNRSIDSRSDLYALGVTLYQMLVGALPFTASDPMEWVHCHVARAPVPPGERLANVPGPVSAIIMKLLAKTADERYQTAFGAASDLQHCLVQWEAQSRIDEFPLGARDTPDRFLIPERLYGREREIENLLASFERVVAGGAPELVLVSGYSGVGKSSVVNELHKVLVPPRGLFASGKFDQYKRDIPYATLAQAFQSLLRPLLSKDEDELRDWQNALCEALSPNGLLIADLVPELKLIIGEQPPVPDLPPRDAQARFQLVFRKFIGVFARAEHPLALFLDDLQWLDAATLDLLEDVLTRPEMRHLLLIGAYRNNEVDSTHPLTRKLKAIRQSGVTVEEIELGPLVSEDVTRLIGDALHCERERVASLAQLVYEKTAGNPFFAIQFVASLAEEGLLVFDHERARWSWDLNRTRETRHTDNVVDLMVGKLSRLPVDTQEALQQLACIGNRAEIGLLEIVCEDVREKTHKALWEAIRTGLVSRIDDSYVFVHDRVQEAAYSLISREMRAAAHLRIGRLLALRTPPEKREEAIFEIVNQLNRGAALMTARDEREQLAELNLTAGKRAAASSAYSSALNYFAAGAALLKDDRWERTHDLAFQLEWRQGECEFMTRQSEAAEERLAMLSSRAADTLELAIVACLRIDLYTTLDRGDRAVAVCLDYLRQLDVEWPSHPTEEEVRLEYEQIWLNIGGRSIEDLIALPLMSDRTNLATLDVLTKVVPPAMFWDTNFGSLVICRAVNFSLLYGNSDGSSFAWVYLGMIAGPYFGNYKAGFKFGRLGYELVEKRGLKRFLARTYMCFGAHVMPWTKHVLACRDLLRRTFDAANRIGDLCFAAYSCNNMNTNLLAAGDPLAQVQCKAEEGFEFARRARFGLVMDIIASQLGLIRTLRGQTPAFGSFNDEQFDESRFERHLASNSTLALPECFYWIRKLQARFLAGDHESAVDASLHAQRLLWSVPSNLEVADYHLYGALARAASCDAASPEQQRMHFEALLAHHKQLSVWAENCPENFENRAVLVAAEIARVEGREIEAMHQYEAAIRSARDSNFVHNEALANELAGRFYAARGFDKIANTYLRDASYDYLRWGADGKVRQLDQLFPQTREAKPLLGATSTIVAPVEHLDLTTVIKVSLAVSGEIVLERLIETIMRTAIEQAGADRGVLMLPRGDELGVGAQASTRGDTVAVVLEEQAEVAAALPQSIVQYVARSRTSVILDDASSESPFHDDSYFRQYRPRSVLCLPLLKQGKLIGVLYLENNLAFRVFTPSRIAVLKLLASEAAISLENSRLYGELRDRELRIRRLMDANIIGIFMWNVDGHIIEANDAFLRIIEYGRDEFDARRVRWTELTPGEWRGADEKAWAELAATGICEPFEKECLRKDGSRVPILVGAALLEGNRDEGVAFVLDLAERKRTEENLRETERQYHKARMELAHANRVTTIGQLMASIAHEIRQPLTAAITNAASGLNWLAHEPPNLGRARDALGLIIKDGHRASDVIDRIRGLVNKEPPPRERLNLNQVILDVVALTRGEAHSNCVELQTQLASNLPPVSGDRVQLQQVTLNLIMNAIQAVSSISDGARNLWICTRLDASNGVLIEVRDSGPGVAPEHLDTLFDAFYTTKPDGMGMGLSICRSIIEAHGGKVWVTANVPRGAVFHVALPALAGPLSDEFA
ncbi:PAS domain S-box-containing protein [Paraburkholderia sp. GAS448]|uniref:trifunctional serine/threonine-protein kinase/ATP-binding protein/sensor histidine kinase n=1 Tax=Paraburkholderia sp. GAS448 TaxID=3035136 RepID=UPI003D1A1FF4